jgi:hypothetical protein
VGALKQKSPVVYSVGLFASVLTKDREAGFFCEAKLGEEVYPDRLQAHREAQVGALQILRYSPPLKV